MTSLTMRLTEQAVRLRPRSLDSHASLVRAVSQRREPAAIPRALRRRCDITATTINGFDVLTLRPHGIRSSSPHVVYLHGGAYVAPLVRSHWRIISELQRRTPVVVTVPLYPRAPNHDIDAALTFLDDVMADLTSRREVGRLIYAGDSAGGGLALAHAIRQRDHGRTEPSALILFSPWVDVSMSNPDIRAIERRDVMLTSRGLTTCGQWWAADRATSDPMVSPLHADLRNLPPVHTFIGDHDLFLPDVTALHQRVGAAGGRSTLVVAEGGFHVYVAAPWTPEARYALDRAASAVAGDPARP